MLLPSICAMRRIFAIGWEFAGLPSIIACAPVQNLRSADQPMGVELSTSIGGQLSALRNRATYRTYLAGPTFSTGRRPKDLMKFASKV